MQGGVVSCWAPVFRSRNVGSWDWSRGDDDGVGVTGAPWASTPSSALEQGSNIDDSTVIRGLTSITESSHCIMAHGTFPFQVHGAPQYVVIIELKNTGWKLLPGAVML